ncbi:MAG: hypothetical protein WDO12_11240 [Pseudomonadota bacterium]
MDEEPGSDAVREGASVVTEHVLAYAELGTALFQAWQRSLQKRLVGAALLAVGLAVAGLLLTFAAIAAAWPTDYRLLVLFGITGIYLVAAAVGAWMLTRPREVTAPMSVFVEELRKDAVLLSAAWRERAS